jgi:hypothetical protein
MRFVHHMYVLTRLQTSDVDVALQAVAYLSR